MKRIYIALAALILIMVGCRENFTELDKGTKGPLALTLKTDASLVLDEHNHAKDGLSLEWTTGTNNKTGNAILYTLQMAKAEDAYENGITLLEDAKHIYTYAISVEDFNTIVRDSFKVNVGEATNFKFRVNAHGIGFDSQLAEVEQTVTAYQPVTSVLYLIGDATPGGWSLEALTPMERSDNGIFTWSGHLGVGNFKMVPEQNFLPSYNKGESETKIVYRGADSDPDEQWTIANAGDYTVNVNLLDLTIEIKEGAILRPRWEHLFLIGNETDWNFWEMVPDPLDPFLFRLGWNFVKGGEFKFGTESGNWANNLKATSDNAPYTQQSMMYVPGFDPDMKWNLLDSELGAYKICVDIRDGNERMIMTPFTPYEQLWMIGDATAAGWTLDNAVEMTKGEGYTFTWTGHLDAGELKFTCDRKGDWSGAWFMSNEANKAPTGEEEHILFIDKSSDDCKAQYLETNISDVDLKWKIQEAGNYTITLDQLKETVIITH